MIFRLVLKGGKGSGHKGHRGRPGLVGGSQPGVGQMSLEMAVGLYTENSPINWDLRKGRELDSQSRRIVETIDSGMKPLGQDTILYRGIKPIKSREMQMAIYGTDKRIVEGIEFSDGGYSSTSSTVFDARKFAGTDGTIWRISAKKGQSALNLGKFSGYVERETLLPRGTKFKVVGRDYDEKRDLIFLDLEIV